MNTNTIKVITLKSVFLLACLAQVQAAPTPTQIGPDSLPVNGAPPAKIGPAPGKSAQQKILARALSPDTRRTLQDAIDSAE